MKWLADERDKENKPGESVVENTATEAVR